MLIKFWLAADMFYHVVLILLFAWVVILFAQLMVSVLLFSWGPAWLRTWSDLSWFINRASRFWFYFFRFRLLMPWFVLMRICGSIFDLFHIIYLSGLFFRSGSFLSIFGFPFWLIYWWIAFQGLHWFNPVILSRCLPFAASFGGLWSKCYICHDPCQCGLYFDPIISVCTVSLLNVG